MQEKEEEVRWIVDVDLLNHKSIFLVISLIYRGEVVKKVLFAASNVE